MSEREQWKQSTLFNLEDLDRPDIPVFKDYMTETLLSPSRLPGDILDEMKKLGLKKEFIDWIGKQDYKFVLDSELCQGVGWIRGKTKEIVVGCGEEKETVIGHEEGVNLVNLTKIHELIHLATPRTSRREGALSLFYSAYDTVIDEIAKPYSNDPKFMFYVDRKIPTVYSSQRNSCLG